MADGCVQIRHLHRRQRRFEPLVPHLQPSAINSLLQSLAGQYTKSMRNPSLLRRLPNPPRHLIHNHVVMRRIAAQQTTNTKYRVVLLGLGEHPGRRRNFEGARNAYQGNVFLLRSRPKQPIVSAKKKPFRNKRIEAGDNNSEAFSGRTQITLDRSDRRRGKAFEFDFLVRRFTSPAALPFDHFPLNAAARFSKNAAVPSALSEVAQQTPNKLASKCKP